MSQQYAKDQPAGFENHVKNVAIVGAGGHVGQAIVSSLLAQGKHRITALSRPNSKAALPEGLHAIRRVDYSDPSALTSALQGEDVLIITLAVDASPQVQRSLIDAAVAAKVKFVVPNEWGSDNSNLALARDTILGTAAVETRKYIEETSARAGNGDTKWLALSCSFWYEFSLAGSEVRYGFDFGRKTLTLMDDGNTRICTSTWAQCGRALAAVFALPLLPVDEGDRGTTTLGKFANAAVYITSFVVSQRDMLASVLRVTGGKESDWTITYEPAEARYQRGKEMMAGGNMMGFGLLLYSRVFYPNGDGDFSDKVVNVELGLPQEDFDEATRAGIRLHEAGENFIVARHDG